MEFFVSIFILFFLRENYLVVYIYFISVKITELYVLLTQVLLGFPETPSYHPRDIIVYHLCPSLTSKNGKYKRAERVTTSKQKIFKVFKNVLMFIYLFLRERREKEREREPKAGSGL